jgi:NitT/TauT family transport system substrate-binding protein
MKALADDKAAKEHMAKASGTDVAGFDDQLKTTKLFATPAEALAFTTGADIKAKSELVSNFLFDKALLGKDAKTAGAIGIEFPDKSVFGDKANVKLRFDATFMQAAADGKL